MNVTVEDQGPCRKVLNIDVDADTVDTEYATTVKEFANHARIPGFRPGNAPAKVVERRFAKEITEQVKERLIPKGYRNALDQTNLIPVRVLGAENVVFDRAKGLSFSVTVDVKADFELPAYENMTLTGASTEVDDAALDEAVDGLREYAARYEDVDDRPVAKGDLVQIDYRGVVDDRPIADLDPELAELSEKTDFWMRADENAFIEALGEGIVGAAIGDQRDIPVDFEANHVAAALAGKTATYTVVVKALRGKILPEVDETFLKSFGVATVEELRGRLREDMEQDRAANERSRLKREIADRLLSETTMDLPQSHVEEETYNEVQQIVHQNSTRGVAREVIEENRDEILGAAAQSAEGRVKLEYIVQRIAEKEDIKVEADEVVAQVKELAAARQMSHEDYIKMLAEKDRLDDMQRAVWQGLLTDRVLESILDRAQVTS